MTRPVAKESRKIRRTSEPASGASPGSAGSPGSAADAAQQLADPLSPERLRGLLLRLGLPLAAAWLLGGLFAGFSPSANVQIISLAVPAVLTLAAAAFLFWMWRQVKKARGVAGILSGVATKDQREAALAQLDSKYKENDPTAVFAKAQLLLQDDPRKALEALEAINLSKVMPNVADEARGQRAMIHLLLAEVSAARDLADGIQLSRHQEARSRAMLVAVVAESWARSGQAKRAVDTLSIVDAEDPELESLRPQLYRAQAFAHAHVGDIKRSRRALRKLTEQDARLLGGFLGKKTHPMLQREAKQLLERSGAMPRKMVVQRRQ